MQKIELNLIPVRGVFFSGVSLCNKSEYVYMHCLVLKHTGNGLYYVNHDWDIDFDVKILKLWERSDGPLKEIKKNLSLHILTKR